MMIFQNIKNGDFPSIATNKITGDLDEPVEHSWNMTFIALTVDFPMVSQRSIQGLPSTEE